jgi:hypothetical protein
MLMNTVSVQGTIIKLIKRIVVPRTRVEEGRWKKENFGSKSGIGIKMELSKRIDILIKDYITGYVDASFTNIQTFEPFVHVTVTQKHTLFGSKLQLARIIGPNIRPTCTTKGTKGSIICFFYENRRSMGV